MTTGCAVLQDLFTLMAKRASGVSWSNPSFYGAQTARDLCDILRGPYSAPHSHPLGSRLGTFKSLWTMPFSWRYFTADRTCWITRLASFSV